jgi:ParB family chromosome partitioning protein
MYSAKRVRRYEVVEPPIEFVKPDLLQPRKKYNPGKLEELTSSVREKGVINMPIAETMGSEQYRNYVMQYPESNLKQKLLNEIEEGKTYYLTVVGHRRYISALKAGYNRIKVKATKNLSVLERRMIQNHEASQLSFTPWAKAKSSYNLYLLMKEQKEAMGEVFTRDDFARYMGIGRETMRGRIKYVIDVIPKVKDLVEKQRTARYTNVMLIASNTKNPEKQYIYAVRYGAIPEKKLKEILKKGDGKKLELDIQTQVQTDGKNKEFWALRDRLYKLIKLREMIPTFYKAFESEEVRSEYGKLQENVRKLERGLGQKELLILQQMRSPKIQSEDTKHYEKLEKILDKAYLENERNKLEKDPEIGEKLIRKILLKLIDPDPDNPRGEYEENEMQDLTESVKQVGLLNPVLLEKLGKRYKIVTGFRRTEAVKRAGYKKIDAFIVEDLPKHLRLYLQVVEDSQVPFTNDERANSWTQLYDLMSEDLKEDTVLTILEFSRRIGKSPKVVGTAIRYEKMLYDGVKRMVEDELLQYSKSIQLTKMINLDKDTKEEIGRMKKKQYELAINAVIGNHTEDMIKEAVKKELASKKQIDLFTNNHKQALESLAGRLQYEAIWNMKNLNLIVKKLEPNESAIKKICSLERTMKLI